MSLPLIERLERLAKELDLAARRAHQKVKQHQTPHRGSVQEIKYRNRRNGLRTAANFIRVEIDERQLKGADE